MMTQNFLFELLRYGLGKSAECRIPDDVDWERVKTLSQRQGVEGIALDGIDKCYNQGREIDIDLETKFEWIGDVQQMESVYNHHKNIVVKLAKFYQNHGIKMMLMKGIGLSFDYPVPNHRPCGDIDIYLYGDLEKGDKLIHENLGITIDKDQHKHTIFEIDGVTVENHYDFANYHKHRSSKKLDEWLKVDANANILETFGTSEHARANDNVNLDLDENVYLPSARFNAIFLIRHAASHFAAEQITLRHLLDWAFFVEKHYDEVDWDWQWKICQEQNMHQFLLAINIICVRYLGFDASLFRTGGDAELTERVLQEILQPEFQEENPKGMLPYIMSRGRRWWANRWKHKIVYPEGMMATFMSQVSAHLIKPATIRG
jgi:hypothetical protein